MASAAGGNVISDVGCFTIFLFVLNKYTKDRIKI